MIVVATKEPVEAGSRAPHEKGPKVFTSPHCLRKLEGPGFKLTLNKNDHRFTATFDKKLPVSKHWVGEYKKNSCSRTFNKDNEDDWIGKLRDVHEWAWRKHALGVQDVPGLALQPNMAAQTPGCNVPQDVIIELRAEMQAMPDHKKSYTKS